MGKGHYGKVYQGHFRSNPGLKLAIKTFQKADLSPTVLKFIKEEIAGMNRVDHPNICKFIEAFESPTSIYLVIENCEGGNLYEKLNEDFN
jgi:serine/threonine protein kinase